MSVFIVVLQSHYNHIAVLSIYLFLAVVVVVMVVLLVVGAVLIDAYYYYYCSLSL
jgi:hypothetical protein